jgi:hypothetical protein
LNFPMMVTVRKVVTLIHGRHEQFFLTAVLM